MENERNKSIYETAQFYKEKEAAVHITLLSGNWLNGKVMSIKEDRLILDEERYGEMLVLFERIIDDGIAPREPSNKKEEGE